MAGDWIAMRCDLASDPAVIHMAAALGLDEYAVIGRLHHLWSWADQQTTDGVVTLPSRPCHAPGVTDAQQGGDNGAILAWIDRRLATPGFAAAMVSAGWLECFAGGVRFPNFDRWNSQTAKQRLLATKRQAKRRSESRHARVTPKSRPKRDKIVTTGQDRREEEENPPKPPSVAFPACLDDAEFRSLWGEWKADRTARKVRPYTARGEAAQLAKLAEYGRAAAVAAIRDSIANGWQGLFPEKHSAGAAGRTPRRKSDAIDQGIQNILEGLQGHE